MLAGDAAARRGPVHVSPQTYEFCRHFTQRQTESQRIVLAYSLMDDKTTQLFSTPKYVHLQPSLHAEPRLCEHREGGI